MLRLRYIVLAKAFLPILVLLFIVPCTAVETLLCLDRYLGIQMPGSKVEKNPVVWKIFELILVHLYTLKWNHWHIKVKMVQKFSALYFVTMEIMKIIGKSKISPFWLLFYSSFLDFASSLANVFTKYFVKNHVNIQRNNFVYLILHNLKKWY